MLIKRGGKAYKNYITNLRRVDKRLAHARYRENDFHYKTWLVPWISTEVMGVYSFDIILAHLLLKFQHRDMLNISSSSYFDV